MPENSYVTVSGFIEFDPVEREANGKQIVEAVIRTEGGDGKYVRLTVWPEIQLDTPLKKNDYVAARGKYTSNVWQTADGSKRTTHQISVTTLVRVAALPRLARDDVVFKPTPEIPQGKLPF